MTSVLGLHHVTTVAGDPQRNLDFYAGVLGLRLVKRTVDFDDPEMYHFVYGDEVGTPGGLMTTIPWPGAHRGRLGAGQAGVTAFAVLPSALGFWVERLLRSGVPYERPTKRVFGGVAESVLAFRDPDGTLLEIVAHPGAEARPAWTGAPGIAVEDAIRGFHSTALWVEAAEATERVLVDTLGFRAVAEAAGVRRFAAGDGGVGTLVDVRAVGGFVRGELGTGTVHHIALRVADEAAALALRARALAAGLEPSDVVDRKYFRSVYVREPGGVLLELATDGPGFTVDEPLAALGQSLQLPPQHEPRRAYLEAVLPPVRLPAPVGAADLLGADEAPDDAPLGFVHRFVPPDDAAGAAAGTTLLLLHGTGGDEDDLLPLGRRLLPGAALLSPRGRVLEGTMPRFFRRLAVGVLDQDDLRARTEELAAFVDRAAAAYARRRDRVIAVGFSNGANIAASLLLRRGAVVRGAVLLSPVLPFEPEAAPALGGTAVFIGAGRADAMVPPAQVERLAEVLRGAGADVTLHWEPGGHEIAPRAVEAARGWLAGVAADG